MNKSGNVEGFLYDTLGNESAVYSPEKKEEGIIKKVLLNKWNVESESNISSFQAATEVSSICTSNDCCCMDTSMYQLIRRYSIPFPNLAERKIITESFCS